MAATPATLPQVAERIFWAAVITALSTLTGGAILDVDVEALQAVGMALLGGVFSGILQFARYRLSVLPNPGDGLPFLPAPNVQGDE